MYAHQNIGAASDRILAALVSGLEIEFGHGAGAALAQRFLEAEEVDFHWDARREERWVGAYESMEDDGIDLDRVAIWGQLHGEFFTAMMIVDGDGIARGMMGRRSFESGKAARQAYAEA